MERMINYGIYYWPTFSQTSKDREIACESLEEIDGSELGMMMLFEIYMTEDPNNEEYIKDDEMVWSSIDTERNGNTLQYTDFPEEHQVYLMPQFPFMIISKEVVNNKLIVRVV